MSSSGRWGARQAEARGRSGRLHRRRGPGPDGAEPRLRVEADREARAGQGKLLKGVCQDVRRDVPRRATNKDRGVDELGTFREFLEEIRRDHPQFYMVPDNASYHKSKAVKEYVESIGGDVGLEFLPPYTPQLSPVETVWRDLKKRLAGRFFRSLDELKAAITAILEREMGNRLKGYLVA